MSEEILKALMQLFALIVKQGSGVQEKEVAFVKNFLTLQLNESAVDEYLSLFYEFAELDRQEPDAIVERKSPSVKDSVRILGICNKINRTLTQKQKVIVVVRLFELLDADKKFTYQRMTIINTVAEVFNVAKEEFEDIELFIRELGSPDPSPPKIAHYNLDDLKKEHELTSNKHKCLSILWIESVDLFFMKHHCRTEILLNGVAVNPGKIHLFSNGSSLKSQSGIHIYYSDVVSRFRKDRDRDRIRFEADDVSYRFPGGDYGIQNISFAEEEGRLIGILGASGVGKSTLVKILSGLNEPDNGTVYINGLGLHKNQDKFKGIIGYIPQDDLLIDELTVYQNLYYNARLCFSKKSDAEIHQVVIRTLSSLGLEDKKNLKVGSPRQNIISGGQRKRLNIALELIREPLILFVDEPTSGLSSRDSENVMDLLLELTQKGKLIFVVIHQPSSEIFKLFNNVLILDDGGRMIFYGNPVESIIYFKTRDAQINPDVGECPTCGTVNPEQIFNIVDKKVVDEFGQYTQRRKVSPEKWESHYRSTHALPKLKTDAQPLIKTFRAPNWIKQFKVFFIRNILSKISNTQYVILNILETPILAFVLAYIIRYIADPESNTYIFRENENIPIYIFMSLIVALFVGLTVSAEEIFKDRKILKRERFLNLSKSSYLISKISILFLISALQTFLFVLIGNSILGIKGMFLYYWLALFTTAAFANVLGLNISASFNSAITIYIIIPLLIVPMMVLSGAMFSFDKLNRSIGSVDKVPLVADLMATKWTYEALMVHQFKHNRFEKHFYDLEKTSSQADFVVSLKIPKLRQALQQTTSLYKDQSLSEQEPGSLTLLRNEILEIQDQAPQFPHDDLNELTSQSFNESTSEKIRNYLDELTRYYAGLLSSSERKIERMINYMLREDARLFQALKDDFYNESIADLVKKRFEKNRLVVYENRIVQQYHPIYQDPEPAGLLGLRTHFFAPEKSLFGHRTDTFWFNIIIVWCMTIILFVTLYFEILKRVVLYLENLRIRK
jgi:ABC-type multidrug transport system ATPase subunit